MCVDYRRFNQQTVTQPFPMPGIDTQLESLACRKIFMTLHLASGFLQILLDAEAKNKITFVTEDITANFKRMPFRLKGAPNTFQKLMGIVFKDLKGASVINTYIDDIIIPSCDWGNMLKSLEQVLVIITNAGLTLKSSKCVFGVTQLDYLGFCITKGFIKRGRKTDVIVNFSRLHDAHEVRRFLGLTGYFRRFIMNYA